MLHLLKKLIQILGPQDLYKLQCQIPTLQFYIVMKYFDPLYFYILSETNFFFMFRISMLLNFVVKFNVYKFSQTIDLPFK